MEEGGSDGKGEEEQEPLNDFIIYESQNYDISH